jgi:lipoate-protein ligase A
MQLLDLTLATPAENVALDEALLDAADAGELKGDVLRLWEPARHFVVVGRSSRVEDEVDVAACRDAGIPILRRTSGGSAIVAGPGCLMYGVLLGYQARQHLRMLDEAHWHVLGVVAKSIVPLLPGIEHCGTSDLAIAGRKFSGNSLRCKREHFLYHGTLLYDFDLPLIGRLLRIPPRQPDYRRGKSHSDFVRNLELAPSALRDALAAAFGASERLERWPQSRTRALVANRYSRDDWNFSR